MAQLTVPVVFDHDDLQKLVNEKIAEVKAQFIPKADYENRLKADMVAALEELRLSIEELDYPKDCDYACNGCLRWSDVDKLMDEKINALRGSEDAE